MKLNTGINSAFPSQMVSEGEKKTEEYGLLVGQAIEYEWFRGGRVNGSRWNTGFQNFHNLRLYARGEQNVQKYKDELSINGDLSYLNLDWKPVPIIPKFVDIVVNGISTKDYEINAYAQDPFSQQKRTKYADTIMRDMMAKPLLNEIKEKLGADLFATSNPEELPGSKEELEIHMQLNYKQSVEIAQEEVIDNVLAFNKYQLTKKRIVEDIVTIGIGAVKTSFNKAEGVVVDYVDPANLVYSYTNDPNFEDIYYVGEIKSMTLAEIKKKFPYLTDKEMEKMVKYPGRDGYIANPNYDNDMVQILFFEYKTFIDQVFKIKKTENGLEKTLEKPDTFNPPESDNFERVSRSIEVLFSGAKVMGVPQMLEWKLAKNMTRPKSDLTKVNMNYVICAPSLYQGRIESLVGRMTGFADMIQLTHLGRRTTWNKGDWLPSISSGKHREPAHKAFPKVAEKWDIQRIIKEYGDAAERMKEGGMDGVELEGQGHLIGQFLSPLTNELENEYGGNFENRLRFTLDVLSEIRKKVGEKFIVGIRCVFDEVQDKGINSTEGFEIAKLLSVNRGRIHTDPILTKHIPIQGMKSAPHLEFAGEIKKEVNIPIFHASKISDVATARYAISNGLVDMVGMTRGHLADPHIVTKIKEKREDDIRPCVGATYCLDRIYQGEEALCIHNAATGRELKMPNIISVANKKKKVIVIGAGPGGLEAARVASERGHNVVVFEAASNPGGQIRLSSKSKRKN